MWYHRLVGIYLIFSKWCQLSRDSAVAFLHVINHFVVEEVNVQVYTLCRLQLYVIVTHLIDFLLQYCNCNWQIA